QAEDGIRDFHVTGVQTCALPICVNGIQFRGAVFTNLSRDHLDFHGSMEQYGAAKAALFDMPALEFAVINRDDAFGAALANKLREIGRASCRERVYISGGALE